MEVVLAVCGTSFPPLRVGLGRSLRGQRVFLYTGLVITGHGLSDARSRPERASVLLDGSFDPDGPGIIEPIDLSSAYWLGAGLNVSLSGLFLLDTGSIYFKPSFEFKQFFDLENPEGNVTSSGTGTWVFKQATWVPEASSTLLLSMLSIAALGAVARRVR